VSSAPEKNPHALAVYEQLCQNYRAIDEFRTKLLGLLPFATAAGVLVLLKDEIDTSDAHLHRAQLFLGAIGTFGFLVTLGLFAYELHGMRKCGALIDAGAALEQKQLRVVGPFTKRPDRLAGFIDEPFAASVIYPATLAAWTFLALALKSERAAIWAAVGVFLVAFALPLGVMRIVDAKRRKQNEEKKAKAAAVGAA
jgi:hypothetical protein